MPDRIIEQGPGFTIAVSDELGTMTHYGGIQREDGNVNFGFVDLRSWPELVDSIPEVRKSNALGRLLRTINAQTSPLMSIGCECAEFQLKEALGSGESIHVGGYIDITFYDPEKNQTESALIHVARAILGRIAAPPGNTVIQFEMIVEPLKLFFGTTGHYGLMLKPNGYGKTSPEAWRAFEHATGAIEAALRALIDEADRRQ
jgi:hypothetical protein